MRSEKRPGVALVNDLILPRRNPTQNSHQTTLLFQVTGTECRNGLHTLIEGGSNNFYY